MKKLIKSLISGTISVRSRAYFTSFLYFIDDIINSDDDTCMCCCCRGCC
jgi:hypothetical protein